MAPSINEAKLIHEFREKFEGVCDGERDEYFARWLKASDWNEENAEKMLKKSLNWRLENGIDRILEWEAPPHIKATCPYYIHGFAPDNSPIIYVPLGRWNIRKVIAEEGREILIKYILQYFERVVRAGLDNNSKLITYFDMEGYSIKQLASITATEAVLTSVKSFEANYPEMTKETHFINTPKIFMLIFNIVKPLLSKSSLANMEIHSGPITSFNFNTKDLSYWSYSPLRSQIKSRN